MKRLVIPVILLGISIALSAQSHVDALRYSQHSIGGTARYVSMGGAFGALGGDFSTLSDNPAGLGIYRKSEFTFTPEFYITNTTGRYWDKEVQESNFNFNLNNLGYVGSFNYTDGILKALNFGIGYNKVANYHRNTIINGVNPYTSYGDYMAGNANGFGLETFNSELFYHAFVIDDDTLTGGYKLNDSQDGYFDGNGAFIPTEQKVVNEEKGKINEWAFSVGFDIDHMFYIGASLGLQPVYYSSEKSWKEYDGDYSDFQYFEYTESLTVRGMGVSGKVGAIFRPVPMFRLGVAYHSPIKYSLREKYSTSIWSRYINQVYKPIDEYGYEIDYLESNYTVVKPAKYLGSVAVVLGKFLILSGDIEHTNYSKMRMNASEFDLDGENENIRVIYKKVTNYKFGSELRIDKTYFRAGFGYYGSPYSASEENHDAFRLVYSGGLGFRDESFFFDIAYQYVTYDERQFLYGVSFDNTDYYSVANIDNKSHRIMTTIGFRF